MFSKPMTQEHKDKIAAAARGRKRSDKAKAAIAKGMAINRSKFIGTAVAQAGTIAQPGTIVWTEWYATAGRRLPRVCAANTKSLLDAYSVTAVWSVSKEHYVFSVPHMNFDGPRAIRQATAFILESAAAHRYNLTKTLLFRHLDLLTIGLSPVV